MADLVEERRSSSSAGRARAGASSKRARQVSGETPSSTRHTGCTNPCAGQHPALAAAAAVVWAAQMRPRSRTLAAQTRARTPSSSPSARCPSAGSTPGNLAQRARSLRARAVGARKRQRTICCAVRVWSRALAGRAAHPWRVPDELRASPQLLSQPFFARSAATVSAEKKERAKKKPGGVGIEGRRIFARANSKFTTYRTVSRYQRSGTHVAGLCRHSYAVRPSGDAARPRRSSTFPRARSVRPPPQS